MWDGSHTDLLSGKYMFIDMHDIDSPNKSAFCFTVNIHVVSDVCSNKLSTTPSTPGVEPRKELL